MRWAWPLLCAACAASPTPPPAHVMIEAPPAAPAPPPDDDCAPVLATGPLEPHSIEQAELRAGDVRAGGHLIARGDRIGAWAFGARVVALAIVDGELRVVTEDGGLYAVPDLDAPPRLLADLGRRVYSVTGGAPGALHVRDAPDFGTLMRVEGGALRAVPGVPAGVVADAIFSAPDRAVIRLFGGAVARLEGARLTPVPTAQPVRALLARADGVFGELAPAAPRTDFTRPPEIVHVRLGDPPPDARPARPVVESPRCADHALGPTCTLRVCERALSLTCDGAPVAMDPLPSEAGGWLHPVPFGDDRRFALDLGRFFLGTREGDRVRFTALAVERGWSRELRAAHGRWLHLPSTRDHHAPGETDVVYDLETRQTVDLGAYRGRERSQLLADGTLFRLRLDGGRPHASLGPPDATWRELSLPPDALDVAFLDARRGVSVGRDGTTIRVTCDAGDRWRALPFEGGERARIRIPPDGERPTPGLVACDDGACAITLDPPVSVDFARRAARPRPLAPVRPAPEPATPDRPRRYACRATGPHPPAARAAAPTIEGEGDACVATWRGRDADGAYRARSGPFDCARAPVDAREPLAVTRRGILVGSAHIRGATWLVAGGGAHRLEDAGRVRAIPLPDGRVLTRAELQHLPWRAALLGPGGVEARAVVDFGYDDGTLGAILGDEGPALLAIHAPYDAAPRAFRVPLGLGPPAALPLGWDLCPDDAPAGPVGLVPFPPIYFDGPEDRPYAYAAALRLGSPACVARVQSFQGELLPDRDRLVGLGFTCRPSP